MTTAEANMEVSFGHSRLVPFLAGGIGAMRLEPTLDASSGGALSSDTRFVGDFGGGLKLFFTPQVALRFDWRGHSVNIDNRQRLRLVGRLLVRPQLADVHRGRARPHVRPLTRACDPAA